MDQYKVFKETTAPWSQLVDPILGQGSLHQLIDIIRPVTKSCQSVLHLVITRVSDVMGGARLDLILKVNQKS